MCDDSIFAYGKAVLAAVASLDKSISGAAADCSYPPYRCRDEKERE